MHLTTIKPKNSTEISSPNLKLYSKKNWKLVVNTAQPCKQTK